MMNLLIGLGVGMIAAIALVIMWRMAEHLRKEVQSRGNPLAEEKEARRDARFNSSPRDN